jgi:outer membrane lipoprotein SlyB
VEREGEPSGAGAVAGGVLGALVGQQFGQGGGKTATTVLGAVGGGVAGHEVEKRMKKVTVYQVQLRMDDGGTRTLEQASPPSVGARVRVDGNSLQPMPGN